MQQQRGEAGDSSAEAGRQLLGMGSWHGAAQQTVPSTEQRAPPCPAVCPGWGLTAPCHEKAVYFITVILITVHSG